MNMISEYSIEILYFEVLLMFVLPIALICALMFFGGMLSVEKYTSPGFLALFFRPKALTKKGSSYRAGLLISLIPIIVLSAFPAVRFLDLPIHNVNQVIRSESPDGSKALIVTEWTRFPLTEWLDPEMSVRFSLIEKKSNALLAKKTVHVREISDLGEPLIAWERDIVKIRAFDSGNENWVVTIPLNQ